MTQKIALVIGGTSGIGLGIATTLLQRNINTFIIGRRSIEHPKLRKENILQIDLSDSESIKIIKKKLSSLKLDYIIFSVATEAPLKRFSEINSDEYDYAMLINLKIPFFLTKELLSNFNTGARLLFLTSRLSNSPEEGSLIYCMTKSAIEIFSLGINKELKGKVITSSIIPGVVDTEMQKRLREADPRIFPHVSVYRNMQSRLQSVMAVSESIVEHLCDTDDNTFSSQRVNVADIKNRSIRSKL